GGRSPRNISRQVLGEIIEPRVEEILSLVQREIVKSGYDDLLAAGVVLTGGTATLEGIVELAEQIFNTPVRKGFPVGVGGITDIINNPMYATAVGLVVRGSKNRSGYTMKRSEKNILSGIIKRMERWFNDFF
ncbi:MAG: cell division protein FtsA, partial [Deltaproteobacteria bacterium]|nr:cell division protein FtsA [Deltaproteobacteria bacterium]